MLVIQPVLESKRKASIKLVLSRHRESFSMYAKFSEKLTPDTLVYVSGGRKC